MNCLEKLTKEKDEKNATISSEIDSMKKALLTLTSEIESKEFRNLNQ